MIKFFNKFLRCSLLTVLSLSVIFTLIISIYFISISENIIPSTIALIILSACTYIYLKNICNINTNIKKLFTKNIILHILILAFSLRIIWILLIPSTPVSDFLLMYQSAKEVAQGSYDVFQGTKYFARFAHNTISVLYFSFFYKLVDNPLFLIKLVNVFFQTSAVYFIYLLSKVLYNDTKKARICAFLLSVFPPFIMYTSQTVSENMAIPFYILSMYCFFKSEKSKYDSLYLMLTGLFLSVANLFRMVGIVFCVAYIVYLLIYKGFLKSTTKIALILIPYLFTMYLSSSVLLKAGITDTHLWSSKEPSVTSILKGTNIQHAGRWNIEDAAIPERFNYESKAVKEESLKIIKERLTTTPIHKLLYFYIAKLSTQWGSGDYGAYSWTVPSSKNTPITQFLKSNEALIVIICNFYLLLLIKTIFKSYFRSIHTRNNKDYFFIILFGGYVLLYLLTEMQARYSFIICWLLILLCNPTDITLNKGITTEEPIEKYPVTGIN